MVLLVDQFMQVKCKLQLTSESDSSESIHSTNCEGIRLCASRDIDKNSSVIALICSNDIGNNHIVIYYIEKRQHIRPRLIRPRVIIKQIYYHDYNEDVVALCLDELGNKLTLISASTTIYTIPIKNILLNLHSQQLRSTQGRSMYFYDASITNCCKSIEDPIAVSYWRDSKLIIADRCGKVCLVDLEAKREIYNTSLKGDQIRTIFVVQDNLIVVCHSNKHYQLSLDLIDHANLMIDFHKLPHIFHHQANNLISVLDGTSSRRSVNEAKLLRFYAAKQFFNRPQKPHLVCKMPHLAANETITHLVLTDRLVALATNNDRCLIHSRNCCDLKYLQSSTPTTIDLNSLVKEIIFNHDEKIMLLIKSPVSNDLDNIIDSFLLVTNRSIYCIEALYSCREMYINLIDSHLGISLQREASTFGQLKSLSINPDTIVTNNAIINTFLCQRDDLYEKICYDSRAFSLLFKLDLNSIFEAYGDRSLQRCQFELANRFFQMARFSHSRVLNKYMRVGAYKQTIDYITNLLGSENEILEEKERLDLSRIAFDCLLAKTIVERGKTDLYKVKMKRTLFRKLLDYHHQQAQRQNKTTISPFSVSHQQRSSSKQHQSPNHHHNTSREDSRLLSNTLSGSFDLFRLCGHSPRAQDPKLSATTIIAEHAGGPDEDEEATLTSNTSDGNSNQQKPTTTESQQQAPLISGSFNIKTAFGNKRLINHRLNGLAGGNTCSVQRLECERALVDFVKNLMPGSLYNYAMIQLLDFNLIELIEVLASRSHLRIYSLLKILARERDEDRLIFRDGRNEMFIDKLAEMDQKDLIKIDTSKREFLEFLTSPEVTHVLVKDIGLTSEFYGYQHTLIQFRKFSFAALRHLETYLKLVKLVNKDMCNQQYGQQSHCNNHSNHLALANSASISIAGNDSDNAFDGFDYFRQKQLNNNNIDEANNVDRPVSMRVALTSLQKQTIVDIFTEFMDACLLESTEDSCRLWYNYINFYLNYVGDLKQLEEDILQFIAAKNDCRIAVTLYKAIHRDEMDSMSSKKVTRTIDLKQQQTDLTLVENSNSADITQMTVLSGDSQPAPASIIDPLESMKKLYNLAELFENEFLINLLQRTLELVPLATDLDALSVVAMC